MFPRTGCHLDLTFRISSGAAAVALGAVHHLGSAPAGGFSIKSSTKPASANGQQGDGQPGECVDGVVMGTNTPCVDDDHKATCEQESETSDGDGECKDGKDAKTGQPCTDTDKVGDEEDADPKQAMAVPEVNPPNDVGGCNDGGDNENDGEGND